MNAHINYARKGSGSFGRAPRMTRQRQRTQNMFKWLRIMSKHFYALFCANKNDKF